MNIGTLYIHGQFWALKAFTGISTHDIAVLQQLALLEHPTQYKALKDELSRCYKGMSSRTFQRSLNKLVALEAITRQNIRYFTFYCIAATGKELLKRYNIRLEAYVNNAVVQHGNGL